MSLDKVLIDATLVLFCVFLICFIALLVMIITDGVKEWRRTRKQSKSIKPTVPKPHQA